MRIVVRVTLGVLAAMFLTFGVAAGTASATVAPQPAVAVHTVAVHTVAVHTVAVHTVAVHTAVTPATPTTTPGTNYNKGQQQADAALAKQKLIIGGICVVLLVIVYFGHRAKGKHILRLRNLQNAKG